MSRALQLVTACIVLASPLAAADIAYLAVTDGYWQVWTMSDDAEQQQQVTKTAYDKTRISWFPSGDRLLVNGNDGRAREVRISDGSETILDLGLSGMLDAVISPNGMQVAFSLSTSGSIDDNNIWTVNLDGTGLQKQTRLSHLQHEPAWSRDGQKLYFLSGDGGQAHDIWQLTLASGRVEQLTVGHLYQFDVAAGPNENIAFSSNRSGNYEIWIGSANHKNPPRQLTNHFALDARPSWSPTGKSIAFESSRSDNLNIWMVTLPEGHLRQLTRSRLGARQPVWKPAINEGRP